MYLKNRLSRRFTQIAAVVLSGLLWYISNGLHGDYWYLLWIAPLPILLVSFESSAKEVFSLSFIAYLIGRLSWFGYLVNVVTLAPAIIFTIAHSLIFAIIMLLTKKMIAKTHSWYAVFAFPLFFTAFEWLLMKFSQDGSASSIAYSQMNFLPIIQIASITGLLGITFVITFIPSAIALGWHFRRERVKWSRLIFVALLIIVPLFLYGFIRINKPSKSDMITAGLIVLDEEMHSLSNLNDEAEMIHTGNYAGEIGKLAEQGAELVVLPERAINVNKATDSATVQILSDRARQDHVAIVAGYTNYKNETSFNSALTVNAEGLITMDYHKRHLVRVLEDQFVPGDALGLFTFREVQMGTAICKDLDFPDYSKQYGRSHVAIMTVPAWDFVVDDWLHSRMAIMRGVENGFSMIRTARLGRLTISDPYGRVTAESDCSDGVATFLLGDVPTERIETFYSKQRDWFGWLIIFSAAGFLFVILIKRKTIQKGNNRGNAYH